MKSTAASPVALTLLMNKNTTNKNPSLLATYYSMYIVSP